MNSTELSRSHVASLEAARNLMSVRQKSPSDPEMELRLITAGQVADLTHIMAATSGGGTNNYEPMNPFDLTANQAPPAVEAGRLQTRLYALKAKLAASSSSSSGSNSKAIPK